MDKIQVFCFLASYSVAFVLELYRFRGKNQVSRLIALAFSLAGLVAHTLYLLARSRQLHLPPLLSSPHDWLLVLSWLAVISYITLTLCDRDLPIGVFLLPIVLACIGASYFVQTQISKPQLDALRGWKMLHASLLVLGMLGVIVGLVLSLMYLFQQNRLKHRRLLTPGMAMPNLERLARLNRAAILISVPLLTFGFATGIGLILFLRGEREASYWTDPLVLGSAVMWVVMVALFTRLLTTNRGQGRQVALLTLWSCGFLLVTLLGLQIVSGRVGSKTWHAGDPSDLPLSHFVVSRR
ncbi:MAG: cytochrome c biogenesis protein CcsA [Planctomycetales bacterium]